MSQITEEMKGEIKRLIQDPKYGSSNRLRDNLRRRLVRLGLVKFDHLKWIWTITGAGHKALRPLGDHGTPLQAVTFALDVDRSSDSFTFLKCWREGDLDDWPEYYAWLNTPEGKRAA